MNMWFKTQDSSLVVADFQLLSLSECVLDKSPEGRRCYVSLVARRVHFQSDGHLSVK